MSKGRQFQDLSTCMFRMTTPTCTIKLQSQATSQGMNTSQVLIEFAVGLSRFCQFFLPLMLFVNAPNFFSLYHKPPPILL